MDKRILKTFMALAVAGVLTTTSAAPAAAAELVLGTGGIESAYFALGNKLVKAFALDVTGFQVNSQATKGDKDNIKLLGKKRRGAQLGFATLGAAKAAWNAKGKKQNRKIAGLISIGQNKDGKTVVLLASKKLKDAHAEAIVSYLLSDKGKKRMAKLRARWNAQSGAAAFKAAGIPQHPGAKSALKAMGM